MRRYQLSGLEHVHMMRHVPRSYDMTRTHIMHKGVNKHVDVVLRCSPKNWKKKKVTVSVVRGEKKNDAARIRANAKKGYVAVRKVTNDRFEEERRTASTAFETNFGKRSAGSDALIHDMKSQISSMAKKSEDYIDDQLRKKPVTPPQSIPADADNAPSSPTAEEKPLISPETEKILREGGYRLPGDKIPDSDPYAADYLMHASDEEFHFLMDSLEKTLDEACRKYAVQQEAAESRIEEEAPADHGFYSDYTGSYKLPNDVSLSVTHKQEIRNKAKVEDDDNAVEEQFKPTLTFTEGGEHYIPEDGLFGRELNRPGQRTEGNDNSERYVPPAYLFDDNDSQADDDADEAVVPMPDVVPVPSQSMPQDIFYTAEEEQNPAVPPVSSPEEEEEDEIPFFFQQEPEEEPESASDGYPHEDYEQQQVFFPTHPDDGTPEHLYNPPEEKVDFAQPTMYPETAETHEAAYEDFEPPMVFPDSNGEIHASDSPAEPQEAPSQQDDDGEELPPPMIFPDDEEDLPPPMIFPDDEEEGYSPAPVSPDRNEYFDGGADDQGVMDRSGQTLFSRTGDQIKKVIGVIRGSGDIHSRSKKTDAPIRNQNVEITYSDRDRFNQ